VKVRGTKKNTRISCAIPQVEYIVANQWISGILQAVPHLRASKEKGARNMRFGIPYNRDP
jgi:hypothetical protein